MVALRQFGKNVVKERWAYFFIFPHFALYALFFLVPVIVSMVLSLLDYQWWGVEFVGLANYTKAFADPIFWKSVVNTAYYTLGFVPLWLGKALVISALISPFRKQIQTFFKAAFYLPHVTSAVILSMIWLWIYNPPFGLLNYILAIFGVDAVAWLGNTATAMPAIILMQVVMGGGSSIVLLSAAMNGIPAHLYEAAELDGAGPMQTYLRITLPLLKPTLLYLVITGTINSFQVFTNIYLMTQGGPQFSTTTMVYMIYDSAFKQFQFGPASAMAMVLFVITAAFAIVQFRWLGEDVEY
ncbi:MAG: sugar ABC transporter permease [Limnochordia bacterium]|nr:sugar ABC transporter permease [Limnochordia bacterium]